MRMNQSYDPETGTTSMSVQVSQVDLRVMDKLRYRMLIDAMDMLSQVMDEAQWIEIPDSIPDWMVK